MSGSQSTLAAPVAEDAVLKRDGLAALKMLYVAEHKAKEIGMRSIAILVFPNVVKAGFIAGVQGGTAS
jgi:lipid-binding SYLF domain-containing protein